MTCEIPLTRGFVAIIDDEDYERVSQKKWSANGKNASRRSVYAVSWFRDDAGRVKQMALHRFILSPPRGVSVDHIDGDPLNNTRANLRLCSHAENMRNRKPHTRTANDCRFKGVFFNQSPGRCYSRIRANGKLIHLGSFGSPEEAARAYDEAAIKYHGEFARLNFPQDRAAA